jgi:branched-chain amino acid transport system ATP-binding protein
MSGLLEVKDIRVYIKSFYIVQEISFDVPENQVVVLFGRNGSGKTTTIKSIAGLIPPRKGSIRFKGEEISGLPPHLIAKKGIGYIPDTFRIFADLTVEENLKIATIKDQKESSEERIEEVFNLFPGIKKFFKQKAKVLSGGQQHMLTIARALVPSTNDLLLVDEPTEGLSPMFRERVTKALLKIKEQNSMLLVEGNFKVASTIGDRYAIMSNGQIVKKGEMKDLIGHKELIEKYLGTRV